MAYQTGTATGPANLLSLLETFLAANGWTITSALTGSVYSKGSLYFGVLAGTDYIRIVGATGLNASNDYWNQPGKPSYVTSSANAGEANNLGGPYTAYYFFEDDDYCHVVIEVSSGLYSHIVFGELAKYGTYTGGAYFQLVNWDTGASYIDDPDSSRHTVPWGGWDEEHQGVRADVDGSSDNWEENSGRGAFRTGTNLYGREDYGLLECMPNDFTLESPLLAIHVQFPRPSSLYSLIGYVKDMRLVNMENINPGQVITLGSDNWYCFPIRAKVASGGGVDSSGNYGFAYKQVTT